MCDLVVGYQYLGGACCLHRQRLVAHYMGSHTSRLQHKFSTPHTEVTNLIYINTLLYSTLIYNLCSTRINKFITKNPTRCNNVSKFYYYIFIWSSTCFRRHTAHHQEPKTALAASGFSYVESCWTCSWWTLSGTLWLTTSTNYTCNNLHRITYQHTVPDNVHQLHIQQPSTYAKPDAASAVLGSWWWAVCRLKHVKLHTNME